jgi:2-polyprenyl-3-methyl-5-hydroxy-6-metoxy-1,4-benzoquinol methylase
MKTLPELKNSVFHTSLPDKKYDFLLIPETIEHVDNPCQFLQSIIPLTTEKTEIMVTAPNAFSPTWQNKFEGKEFRELVHPDHKCWFSPYTLTNTILNAYKKLMNVNIIEIGVLDDETMAYVHFTLSNNTPKFPTPPSYCELFKTRRSENLNFVEIGGDGARMQLWLDYFPNAHIYSDSAAHERITTLDLDQSSTASIIEQFYSNVGSVQFDMIVDCGGVHPFTVSWEMLKLLESRLKPGGIYFIEQIADYDETVVGNPRFQCQYVPSKNIFIMKRNS